MNKEKEFKLLFPKYIFIIAAVVILIALSAIVLNILKLFHLEGLSPYQPVIDTISIALAVLIIVTVLYSVLFSRFSFKEDKLVFHLSIFYIGVPYQNMLLLRHDIKSNLLLLYYNLPTEEKEENIKYLVINIHKEYTDKFIQKIRENNRRVIYEIFDKEKEENDNGRKE